MFLTFEECWFNVHRPLKSFGSLLRQAPFWHTYSLQRPMIPAFHSFRWTFTFEEVMYATAGVSFICEPTPLKSLVRGHIGLGSEKVCHWKSYFSRKKSYSKADVNWTNFLQRKRYNSKANVQQKMENAGIIGLWREYVCQNGAKRSSKPKYFKGRCTLNQLSSKLKNTSKANVC